MKTFADGAPLRLSLPWMAPVDGHDNAYKHALGNRIEDAKLYDLIGHFNRYEVKGDRIHFYMRPTLRKNALLKALRSDERWLAFKRHNPEVELAWAEDVAEENL